MKTSKRFISALLAAVFIMQLSACTSEEEIVPENEINDSRGLTIQLEWNTGGSATQSLSDVDLDLYLTLQGEEVAYSESFSRFESVDLMNYYADGTYTVTVAYVGGEKALTYTLYVSGASEDSKEVLYEGLFAAGDRGSEINDLVIIKDGDQFTIQD